MNLSPSCLLTMELLSCLLLGRLPTSSQKELNQNLKGRLLYDPVWSVITV